MSVDEKIFDLVYLACARVDENGNVVHTTEKGTEPVVIEGKRLVIPTKYQLSGAVDPMWQERCLFNPFLENVTQTAPTPVLDWLIRTSQLRLNVTITMLMTHILNVYASPAVQSSLTPEQMTFISRLEGIDAKTLEFYNKSIAPLGQRGEYAFVTLFPKNLGELNGVTYVRTCHASSPMYAELTTKRKFGKSVELAKGNSAKISAVLELILPKIAIPDAYSKGSNSLLAPFAESFLGSMIKLTDHILTVQKIWPEIIIDSKEYGYYNPYELELFSNVDSLVDVIRKIPNVTSIGSPQPVDRTVSDIREQVVEEQRPTRRMYQQPDERDTKPRSRYDYSAPDNRTESTTFSVDQILRNQRSGGGGRNDDFYDDRYDDRRDLDYSRDYRDSYRQGGRSESSRYGGGSRYNRNDDEYYDNNQSGARVTRRNR